MKIERIEIRKLNINPVWTPVICRIYTDEGIYGDGEAALAFDHGATGAMWAIKDFGEMIIGMNPLDNEVIWEKLYKQTYWAQGGGSIVWGAISAIDIALWDIKGKYFGVPLYTLLGGKRREDLRCYASQLQMGWSETRECLGATEEYVEVAKKAVAEGYDAIKIDFFTYDRDGRRFDKDELSRILSPYYLNLQEERVAAVREAVGPEVDILWEAHGNTDANTAVQIGRMAEKYNIFFLEEPSTPNPKMTRFISEHCNIPIAHGERIYTRWQFAPYFENNSVQVIQPDLGNCGGVTEGKKICDMAHVYDVAVQLHVCASPLSNALSLHLESVIPNFLIHEHHRNCLYPHNKVLCDYDFQPVNGRIAPPDRPGIGCEFTEETMNMENAERATVK